MDKTDHRLGRTVLHELLAEEIRDHSYPPPILIRVFLAGYLKASFFGRKPGQFKWDRDESKTEITIKDQFKINELATQKRPMIVINRGPVIPLDMALNNSMSSYDVTSDSSKHVDLMSTQLKLECVANSMYQAEQLGFLVYGFLRYFKSEIRQLGLADIRGFRIDPPEPCAYSDTSTKVESFQCNVLCTTQLYDSWLYRWKTDNEMQEYFERTMLDFRGNKIPPIKGENITIEIGDYVI